MLLNLYYLVNTQQYKRALKEAEKKIYLHAYEYTKHNQTVTAKLLGVSRGKFRAKLKEYLND